MIRDSKVHLEVVEHILSFVQEIGFEVLHLDFSPIKGPEGNIEYLIHLKKTDQISRDAPVSAAAVVEAAHAALD